MERIYLDKVAETDMPKRIPPRRKYNNLTRDDVRFLTDTKIRSYWRDVLLGSKDIAYIDKVIGKVNYLMRHGYSTTRKMTEEEYISNVGGREEWLYDLARFALQGGKGAAGREDMAETVFVTFRDE